MNPAKIKGVTDWPHPQNIKDIWAFLGFTGFYCYFILNYSKIVHSLIDLTKKATTFHWGKAQIDAFKTLKMLMCKKAILWQPNYKDPFYLTMDASMYGIITKSDKSLPDIT